METIKILVIGNKILYEDISDKLKGFNLIIRSNKVNNWEQTKTDRTDIWLCDIYDQKMLPIFDKIPKDYLKTVKGYLFFKENDIYVTLSDLTRYCDIKNNICVISYNGIDIKKYILEYTGMYNNDGYRISNFIWTVLFALHIRPATTDIQNEIYIAGCDIYNRSHLKDSIEHKNIYKAEEKFLQNMIHNGKLKYIS